MPKNAPFVRCDLHRSLMTAVRLRVPDLQMNTHGFRCAEVGCTRHYTDVRGYFDVIEGRVLNDKFQQRCPKCGRPMYLSRAQEQEEFWRCPVPQCGHEQRRVA